MESSVLGGASGRRPYAEEVEREHEGVGCDVERSGGKVVDEMQNPYMVARMSTPPHAHVLDKSAGQTSTPVPYFACVDFTRVSFAGC